MNTPLFRPFAAKYLILPDAIEEESETIGSVTLTVPKDPNKQAVEGTVVARGKSCTELQIGEKAVYGKFSGYDLHLDGVDYKVLQEGELFGEKLPEEFDDRPQGAVPAMVKAPPNPGVCFICGEAASTPTGTLCTDCLPF